MLESLRAHLTFSLSMILVSNHKKESIAARCIVSYLNKDSSSKEEYKEFQEERARGTNVRSLVWHEKKVLLEEGGYIHKVVVSLDGKVN